MPSIVGGKDFFRGLLKSIFNLLGASNTAIAHQSCFNPIREFILAGGGDVSSFIRWATSADFLIPRLGNFDHTIAVYSRGTCVEGISIIFGAWIWFAKFTENYQGPDFCYSYCVDPFREADPAESRHWLADAHDMPRFSDGIDQPNEAVRSFSKKRIESLLERYSARAQTAEVSALVDRVLGSATCGEPTRGDIERLNDEIMKLVVRKLS